MADCVAITLGIVGRDHGQYKVPNARRRPRRSPIEMSQCLLFKTGAIFDEESSKVSSNMDYRLLKNSARTGKPGEQTEPARAQATLTL